MAKLRALLSYNCLTAVLEGRNVAPPLSPDENSAAATGREQHLVGMGWYLPSQGYFSGSNVEALYTLMQ